MYWLKFFFIATPLPGCETDSVELIQILRQNIFHFSFDTERKTQFSYDTGKKLISILKSKQEINQRSWKVLWKISIVTG